MIPYSVREGLAGFRRAKFASFAATSAMAVALVLIGLFALVSFEAQQVADWLRQRVGEVELFLADAEPHQYDVLYERARATPGVVDAIFIDKEEAQRIFREEFGEEAELFNDVFLPASIKVRVEPDYVNADSLASLAAEFGSWNRVTEVVFNESILAKVQQNLRLLTILGLVLGTLVVLASIFLVANTIRLTIYARRLLIRTMKLVGATDAFVRRPFLVEGMMQGFVAGVMAAFVVYGLYALMASSIAQFANESPWPLVILCVGVCMIGILLGWLGSYFSVRRFIRSVALH